MASRPALPQPDPALLAFVRALARADAEETWAPHLRRMDQSEARRREENLKQEPSRVQLAIMPCPDDSRVYFLQGAEDGPIKIGRSIDPEARRRSLQTASGERLRILATIRGGREHERYLHSVFALDRLQGEWFKPTERILRFVEACQ